MSSPASFPPQAHLTELWRGVSALSVKHIPDEKARREFMFEFLGLIDNANDRIEQAALSLPAVTVKDAPAQLLSVTDKAMWVLGWQACKTRIMHTLYLTQESKHDGG